MFQEILNAATRINGQAHRTPILKSQTLNERVGAEIFLKCENFQRMGAFKFRGAYNSISQLSQAERERGVITYSSGNHAQAVALVGQILGVKSTIVMPHNAPLTKKAATQEYGATIFEYDPAEEARETLAKQIAAEKGYTLIPPYDYYPTIFGQGTAALEFYQDMPNLDGLLVPTGGGGLLAGSALAAKGLNPKTLVMGIEPELADDAARSFRSKTLQSVHNPPTIADGTRTPSLGELNFPIILEYVDGIQTVTEAAIIEAVQFLFYRMKIVVEPSGALGVAALMSGAVKAQGRVGVIISGGNVDSATMTQILNGKSNA